MSVVVSAEGGRWERGVGFVGTANGRGAFYGRAPKKKTVPSKRTSGGEKKSKFAYLTPAFFKKMIYFFYAEWFF